MSRVIEWEIERAIERSSDQVCQVPSFCLTFRHFLLGTTSMTGLVTVEGGQVKTFWKPVSRWERNLKNSHTLTLPLSLDMLNNLCFHLYAQKSLFIAENVNAFLGHQWFSLTKLFISTRSSEMTVFRAGSQLKKAMIFSAYTSKQKLDIYGSQTVLKAFLLWPCKRGTFWTLSTQSIQLIAVTP